MLKHFIFFVIILSPLSNYGQMIRFDEKGLFEGYLSTLRYAPGLAVRKLEKTAAENAKNKSREKNVELRKTIVNAEIVENSYVSPSLISRQQIREIQQSCFQAFPMPSSIFKRNECNRNFSYHTIMQAQLNSIIDSYTRSRKSTDPANHLLVEQTYDRISKKINEGFSKLNRDIENEKALIFRLKDKIKP